MENNYRKIIKLDIKLNNIFENNDIDKINPIHIKYKFSYEFDYGYIEYKRTLKSYRNKKDKLLRQIYWRMYESILFNNTTNPKCYYIIGLEDNGCSSNLNINELSDSLNIIKESINNTDIILSYIYLFNDLNKSYLLVIKLYIEHSNFNFFE